jgi:hypothetical protein
MPRQLLIYVRISQIAEMTLSFHVTLMLPRPDRRISRAEI